MSPRRQFMAREDSPRSTATGAQSPGTGEGTLAERSLIGRFDLLSAWPLKKAAERPKARRRMGAPSRKRPHFPQVAQPQGTMRPGRAMRSNAAKRPNPRDVLGTSRQDSEKTRSRGRRRVPKASPRPLGRAFKSCRVRPLESFGVRVRPGRQPGQATLKSPGGNPMQVRALPRAR